MSTSDNNPGTSPDGVSCDVIVEREGRVTVRFLDYEDLARFFRRRDGFGAVAQTVPHYTNSREFAALLGISERSLFKIKKGLQKGVHFTVQGRRVLYLTTPAMAFINQYDLLSRDTPEHPSDEQVVRNEMLRRCAKGGQGTSGRRAGRGS